MYIEEEDLKFINDMLQALINDLAKTTSGNISHKRPSLIGGLFTLQNLLNGDI